MILTMLLALAGSSESVLPKYIDDQTSAVVRTYGSCLESASLELEPSQASFDDIFEAAKTDCADSWTTSYFSVIEDLNKMPASPTGKSSQQVAIEFLESIVESTKSETRLKVLRQRAGLKVE